MENQKLVQNQGLLDALESLSAALSVVSSSVDMVREELQIVLSVLAYEPAPVCVAAENPSAPAESAPQIYLVEADEDATGSTPDELSCHEIERQNHRHRSVAIAAVGR